MLARAYRELIPRLTENDAVIQALAPSDTQPMSALADDLSAVLNTWKADMEERAGFRWQTALSDGQVRLCFGIMEWGRDDEAWTSTGVADAYKSGDLPRMRAEQGAPWWVRFPDPATCVLVFDESRKPGPAMYARKYTVARLDYEMASAASSTDSQTMVIDMGDEEQSPQEPLTSTSGNPGASPSSGNDWGETVTIRQFWTRDWFYEFVDNEPEPRKAFPHKQGRIRVELCAAIDTRDPDPVRRWLPVLEGIYVQKPFIDRIMTLTGAMTEMGAKPYTYLKQTSMSALTQFEDGTPENARTQSSLNDALPPGFEYGQVTFASPQQLQQWLAFAIEEFEKSKPATGTAEISATSAPWTARLAQQQSSVGPKHLVTNQARCIAAAMNDIVQCHAREAEEGGFGEDIHAYSYSKEDGTVDRSKVISIDWKKLAGFRVTVNINPLSSAEQTTNSQIAADFYERGLIVEEDFHEARGVPNPSQYVIRRKAQAVSEPWIDAALKQHAAAVFGGKLLAGQNGQLIDMNAQIADPNAVLMERGFKPQQQPAALPGGGGASPMPMAQPQPVGAQPMPPGGQLAAPGAIPIGGV
jgi:hypothetical protein